ncbi:MAG: hypothetical protein H0U16_02145 [Actinobacteria bacterium]|nr:hypothetical protein [Actinomycetota bacterium]
MEVPTSQQTHELSPDELATLKKGHVVVQAADSAGENICLTFHPPTYVREKLVRPFEMAEFNPQGALGNAHPNRVRDPPRDSICHTI